jgi:F-type H+-transporting ATPase subunit b
MNIMELFVNVAQASEGGVAGTLGLNGYYFLGQLFNFAVVMFIMWKWVFPAVTRAMIARSERIEKSLVDAEKVSKEKAEFEVWREKEMTKTREEAALIIKETKEKAEQMEAGVLKRTKEEQDKILASAKLRIAEEEQQAVMRAKQELAGLVVQATQSILEEKMDPVKDQGVIKKALKQILA